ncbi:MAG: hypothetical protein KKD18_05870 [Nanoarchaeota archaeon]|nr:hypothetical protein [Nanoarchaeota archaeon]
MINRKITVFMQVALLFGAIFATAQFTKVVSGEDLLESLGIGSDDSVQTCVETIDGSVCQEFNKDVCGVVCKEPCLDGEREKVDGCEVGVCIDDDEGLCSAGATKKQCEDKGGRFVEGSINQVAECEQHCCILGNEAQFVTKERCEIISRELEIDMNFNTDYYNPDFCSMFAKQNQMGACTWPSASEEEKYECKFTSLGECIQSSDLGVEFHEGMLCSNPDLNTVCERQNNTACVPGLDGVYWFDSCGNQENLFYLNKDASWNGGMLLELNDSCLMGSPGNYLQNQATCGNCNRLLGNVCGEEVEGQELNDDPDSGVVCRDLGCYEEDGTRRENGETWCVYTTDFGVSADVPLLGSISNYVNIPFIGSMIRSKSAPGGEHFRKSCINGEIAVEPCGPYRTGICIETQTEISSSKEISLAVCIPNRWAECLNYNAGGDGVLADLTNAMSQISSIPIVGQYAGKVLKLPAEAEKAKVLNMMFSCEKDPDCFVKTVNVDKDFKFPMCMPKYPPGIYKKEMDQNDVGICAFASQMCSTVWVKESVPFTFGLATHWECKANCNCVDGGTPSDAKPSQKFVSEMHALCVSLGDCGAKVNYLGDVGGLMNGYALKKAEYKGMPKAPDKDRKKKNIFGMPPSPVDDSKPAPGAYIDGMKYNQTGSSSSGLFGFGGNSNGGSDGGSGGGGDGGVVGAPRPPGRPNDPSMTTGLIASGVAGATALGATIAVKSVVSAGTYAGANVLAGAPAGLIAFQGAAIGAAISIAIVSILLGVSGVGRGVGTAGTIGYMAVGGMGGAMAGAAVAQGGLGALVGSGSGGSSAIGGAWMGPVGLAIVIIVIIDIIAQWLAGAGEIRTVEVYFECKPWTAPATAKCEECGKNGLPCNQYNCETLGTECQFVPENEGAVDEELPVCIKVAYDDVSGPKITEMLDDALTQGFQYTNVEGLGTQSTHFKVTKTRAVDGCISQFERINFGFLLDEPGECAYSFEPGVPFDEMYPLGVGGLRYQQRHAITDIWEEIDSASEDVQNLDVYIQCKDYQLDENRGGTIGGENVLSFCVNPLDLTAPYIVRTNIPGGYVAPYNQENVSIIVTFDEPVEGARLDFEDLPYDEMQYEMVCSDNVCYVEVPIEFGNNQYYVSARDLDGNELSGGEPIVVQRSEDPLEITSITYDGEDLDGMTITRGNILNAIEVVVETTGGVDGTATCGYRLNGYGEALFEETGGGVTSTHRQSFTSMLSGYYEMGIACTDVAGNNALEEISFTIEADLVGPSVSRVYDDSGTLMVVTDEPGTCSYTHDSCNFDVGEGEMMNGGDYIHSTNLDYQAIYYVKCKDGFDNEPSGCSIVVSGGEF